MKYIDNFLNTITMYRLLLYYLIGLLIVGVLFSFVGLLPFNPFLFIISALFLMAVSILSNDMFAKVFEAHTNVESVYITALILALIIKPAGNVHELIFLGWAALLATASKYILAIGKKHIFNPVAVSVALTAFVLGDSATWWVGTVWMFPFVLAGGLMIIRKIQREDLVVSFIGVATLVMLTASALNGTNTLFVFKKIFVDTPILFFAFIMLTEPLTTPPTKHLRIWYGALVGLLFAPQIHIGSLYTTPELALIAGNIYSYIVSPKEKLLLRLRNKIQIAPNIFDFIFEDHTDFTFTPGQYMEWTLGHNRPDTRGNRRYFTIASSPTEKNIRIGIRFFDASSTFKKTLSAMKPGDTLMAGQRSGDFVLPKDPKQKIVFIAGGIGITPYRSMVKYILDTNEKRDIVLFYSNKTKSEIVYRDVFDAAAALTGMKTIYVLTDREHIPANWTGNVGRIDASMIASEIPDYKERVFYLSGPSSLVNGFKKTLANMDIPNHQMVTDFFPGFM